MPRIEYGQDAIETHLHPLSRSLDCTFDSTLRENRQESVRSDKKGISYVYMGNQSAFACSINLRQLVEERQKRNDGVKVINHQIGVNTVHNKILSGHMTMEASQLEQSCYYLIMPAQPVITIGGTMGYIVEVSSIQILASGEKDEEFFIFEYYYDLSKDCEVIVNDAWNDLKNDIPSLLNTIDLFEISTPPSSIPAPPPSIPTSISPALLKPLGAKLPLQSTVHQSALDDKPSDSCVVSLAPVKERSQDASSGPLLTPIGGLETPSIHLLHSIKGASDSEKAPRGSEDQQTPLNSHSTHKSIGTAAQLDVALCNDDRQAASSAPASSYDFARNVLEEMVTEQKEQEEKVKMCKIEVQRKRAALEEADCQAMHEARILQKRRAQVIKMNATMIRLRNAASADSPDHIAASEPLARL